MDFETLYRAHYDFIWRMLRRLGVRERHAEDACQIVFLAAYRRLSEFESRSSYKTWLGGIALRVASDYRRSAQVRRECLLEPIAEDSPGSSRDPHQLLEQRERLEELDCVLSQLPSPQLTVLVLHDFERFSGEEIARMVDAPLGTVRSRLRLARQAFTRILSERRSPNQRMAVGGEP